MWYLLKITRITEHIVCGQWLATIENKHCTTKDFYTRPLWLGWGTDQAHLILANNEKPVGAQARRYRQPWMSDDLDVGTVLVWNVKYAASSGTIHPDSMVLIKEAVHDMLERVVGGEAE